jgi:hypothetical protein
MQSKDYQDVLLFGMNEIPIEKAWFILQNLGKFDLTEAKRFPDMFYVDHMERNWISLVRAAQIYTAHCRYVELQLTTSNVALKRKQKKKLKKLRMKEKEQCLGCGGFANLFTIEPCQHSYLCESCWSHYKGRFLDDESAKSWQKLKCLICGDSINHYS